MALGFFFHPTTLIAWVGVLHITVGLMLIFLVLLHSGRGGGLSDMFGGGSTAAGSTVAERNLDRITVLVSLIFVFTTIIFGLLLSG